MRPSALENALFSSDHSPCVDLVMGSESKTICEYVFPHLSESGNIGSTSTAVSCGFLECFGTPFMAWM